MLRKDPKFELRTRAYVSKVLYDKAGKKVTGVLYVDLRTGEEYEQPAGIVVLGAYVFGNTHMLLHCRASASPTTRRPARAWSARTTVTRSRPACTVFFEDK